MKAFIIISLFFLSFLSLFSYNKIELVEKIEDFRIERGLHGYGFNLGNSPSPEKSNCMLNDSIVVFEYYATNDKLEIIERQADRFLPNYNINTAQVEFYYDIIEYKQPFLSKDKNKLIMSGWTEDTSALNLGLYYIDTLSIFKTSNGSLDTNFTIEGYDFINFHNMYNGNVSFMAIKQNTSD